MKLLELICKPKKPKEPTRTFTCAICGFEETAPSTWDGVSLLAHMTCSMLAKQEIYRKEQLVKKNRDQIELIKTAIQEMKEAGEL